MQGMSTTATLRGTRAHYATLADQRSALFGDRPQTAPATGGAGASSSAAVTAAAHDALHFERQNDMQIHHLSQKVNQLKSLSIDIEGEVRDQNSLLDGMSGQFAGTQGLLGATADRLSGIFRGGGSKHMCYLILFCMLVFFILYYLARIGLSRAAGRSPPPNE